MKTRISYIIVALVTMFAVGCHQDMDVVSPQNNATTPEGWIEVEFTANAPIMTEVVVRGADPDGIDVQNLILFCFNDYGLYIPILHALFHLLDTRLFRVACPLVS